VVESKKFIRPPLLLKLKKSPVAVAVTLLLVIATIPFTPEVRVVLPVPSNKVRLKERMFDVASVPIVPSVVIVPVTVPTPT
jgi:hypothetical protein